MKTSTQLKALIRNLAKEKSIQAEINENMKAIESSEVLLQLWHRYQSKNSYASDLPWEVALKSVKELYSKAF